MNGSLDDRERWLVPLSLWGSFLANDGEEWLTMARTSGLPQAHVRVGIAAMGVLYAAAVCDGIRTRGRGWLYQDVQLVFGAHGFGHLGAALLARRYTSGVATSPTVVLPQWWWARRRLRAAGVPTTARPLRAVALMGAWLGAAHTLGFLTAKLLLAESESTALTDAIQRAGPGTGRGAAAGNRAATAGSPRPGTHAGEGHHAAGQDLPVRDRTRPLHPSGTPSGS